jgi:hypothetical protein
MLRWPASAPRFSVLAFTVDLGTKSNNGVTFHFSHFTQAAQRSGVKLNSTFRRRFGNNSVTQPAAERNQYA